jgi:hypothetical protein
MQSKHSGQEVIPSARRLIRSLRDMGYDFVAAVADLVDNSIEAGATKVNIDIEFDGDDSWVRVADNGKGMSAHQLMEAMRYGSEREYEEGNLGKFGLGLKTASLSQCQKLSVATRTATNTSDIIAFCWDLAHIEKTNRWEILPLQRNGLSPSIREALKDKTGTVVLWERVDRILGYKHPYGEASRKRLSMMCRELEQHLAMVFHRFMTGEISGRKLRIFLNENEVQPWDPFTRKEAKTRILPAIMLTLEHEGVCGQVKLEPFILPHQNDFSSPAAFKRASGPANWNQQQGFYIYRAERLIQSGGWCRLRTIDEHTKLARVALSFSPMLDDAFKINVAKMRVQLPQQIRDQVEEAIKPVLRIAQETYRKNSTREPSSSSPVSEVSRRPESLLNTSASFQATFETATPSLQSTHVEPTTKKLWTLDELQQQLENVAKPNEKLVVTKVFTRFRRSLAK